MSEELHNCSVDEIAAPSFAFNFGYGAAITYCFEEEGGVLTASNGEYASPVNFCPFCGYQAKTLPWPTLIERRIGD